MSRANRVGFACIAAAALLAVSCASPPGGAPGAALVESTVVKFSYNAVNPASVHIAADGNVRWVNTAPDTRGFVVLPASIASRFRCADLKPYFSKTENDYRSLPITDAESERVELPCRLAPGTYDYEIWLKGTGFGDEFDAGKPEQILRAKIIVE